MLVSSAQIVAERARQALAASPIFDLRELQVARREDDALVISGRVSSFYHKQLAQELIRTVVRDQRLVNAVDVQPE